MSRPALVWKKSIFAQLNENIKGVQTNPTLADVAHNIGTNSKVGAIIEVLNKRQDLLDDAVVLEANSGTHNKTSVRSGLPKGT